MKQKIPMILLPVEVEVSKELIEIELPIFKQKKIQVKKPNKETVGPAFHEKSAKNQKVNVKIRHEEKMKKKYGRPKTRGQKRK